MKIISILLLILVCSCSSSKEKKVTANKMAGNGIVASMHSTTLQSVKGTVSFEDIGKEIKVTANVEGLKPDAKLGFHIHEKGVCEGDYKSAGGHFNPYGKKHGRPEGQERHIGDMGNLETNSQGAAKEVILMPKITPNDLDLIIGKAVIIHAGADDLKTQPTGDAGARLACGLIQK